MSKSKSKSKSTSKTCIVCGIKLNDEYEKLEDNVFYCKECYEYHLSLLNVSSKDKDTKLKSFIAETTISNKETKETTTDKKLSKMSESKTFKNGVKTLRKTSSNKKKCRKNKKKILINFRKDLKNKTFEANKSCTKNCDEGHWVEKHMGIKANSKNEPDLLGFEQKKESKVITFIDKQTDYKYYEGSPIPTRGKYAKCKKQIFWDTFKRSGSKGIRIGGWDLNKWDNDGQRLYIDSNNNINVLYNYDKDKRKDKDKRVPDYYKNKDPHVICQWLKSSLKKAIEDKFNVCGFYILMKSRSNKYNKIAFGPCISFDYWIDQVKKEKIYFDGYSTSDGRWRGCFRAPKAWWFDLIKRYGSIEE